MRASAGPAFTSTGSPCAAANGDLPQVRGRSRGPRASCMRSVIRALGERIVLGVAGVQAPGRELGSRRSRPTRTVRHPTPRSRQDFRRRHPRARHPNAAPRTRPVDPRRTRTAASRQLIQRQSGSSASSLTRPFDFQVSCTMRLNAMRTGPAYSRVHAIAVITAERDEWPPAERNGRWLTRTRTASP